MLPLLLAPLALAGLGPDDVLLVYNADDPEAVATADAYAEARSIPDAQRCALTGVDPTARQVSFDEALTLVLDPVAACLDTTPAPDDIDVIVTVRGLPYRVTLPDSGFFVGLDALLQVGDALVKDGGTPLAGEPQRRQGNLAFASVENPVYLRGGMYAQDMTASFGASIYYSTSPRIVRDESIPPPFERLGTRGDPFFDFTDSLFIVSRLDGFDHDDARALVDRALEADGSFPTAPFVCMRGAEGARGVRDAECEHALRMLDAAGFATEWVPAFDGSFAHDGLIAYWTGTANLKDGIDGVTYAPGAIADNITSFGAGPQNFFCDETGETCPESESQTSIARFIRAGASAAHGTVAEPLNNTFPNAGTLLLYAHGYSLGEAWLYNQRFLYWQNQYLGDPLMAPFAERPTVTLPAAVPANVPIAIDAAHPDGIDGVVAFIGDTRIEADGDLRLPSPQDLGLAEGETVDVRLVATAGPPAPVAPAGWPSEVAFDPGVKGWVTVSLTVDPAVEDAPPEEPAGGCGCTSSALGASPTLLLVALLPVFRRRRHHR